VTPIYHFASVESPDHGHGTLWTTDRDSAKSLADWQRLDLADCQRYRADVTLDSEDSCDISSLLDLLNSPSADVAGLLSMVERGARAGARWVQLLDRTGGQWEEALLYLGDEQIPARPDP